MISEVVSLGTLDIHCLIAGEDGPPLLLLHGGGLTAEVHWGWLIEELASDFRVVAPDTRGHGRSSDTDEEFTYARFSDDVAALVKALDLEAPFVLGYSDGGNTALELALRHPGVARATVVGAAWLRKSDRYLSFLNARFDDSIYGLSIEAALERIDQVVSAEMLEEMRELHAPLGGDFRKLCVKLAKLWGAPLMYPEGTLEGVQNPVLVFTADNDGLIDLADPLEIHARIPGSELYVNPGTDHMTAFNADAKRTLLKFFDRHR